MAELAAGSRRPLGDDLPARHRAPDHLVDPSLKPAIRIVVGGYDPSLAPDAWMDPELGVDFIVRGEGEITFRELLRAIEAQDTAARRRRACWFRDGPPFTQGPPRPVAAIADDVLGLPNRAARVLSGYTMLGRQVDVVETSRGCTFDCSFCSIIEMRGRNFHRFPIERVIADIADAHARGARAMFLVDDNITIDVPRFEALCRAIIDAGLNTIDYLVQGMTGANRRARRAPRAADAEGRVSATCSSGSRTCSSDDLAFLKASAKNRKRGGGVDEQRRDHRGRAAASPRPARRRRSDRRQSGRYAASRSPRISPSRADTWTGRTSSIRRRTPARR